MAYRTGVVVALAVHYELCFVYTCTLYIRYSQSVTQEQEGHQTLYQ